MLSVPSYAFEPMEMDAMSPQNEITNNGEITIQVKGNHVRVLQAAGQTLRIYDVAGNEVETVRIDSNDKTIDLTLQRGCYIVKVGKKAQKISVH